MKIEDCVLKQTYFRSLNTVIAIGEQGQYRVPRQREQHGLGSQSLSRGVSFGFHCGFKNSVRCISAICWSIVCICVHVCGVYIATVFSGVAAVGSVAAFLQATCVLSFVSKCGAEGAATGSPSAADTTFPGLGVGK